MKHLGLFEGIGGFSLAARWMGWETLAWCEWIEWNQRLLKKRFPEAEGFGDITKTDFTKYANRIDILTGGFPCQPYSNAGKRLGKYDERHLWPEMLRAISEVSPRWVVGENVRGIINWGEGLVFDEVQIDLEAKGYKILPFLLPACAVNADHERYRTWFIAYSDKVRLQAPVKGHGETLQLSPTPSNNFGRLAANKWKVSKRNSGDIRNGDGIPDWMERIGGLGNAIVPQVALQIFKAIEQYELTLI